MIQIFPKMEFPDSHKHNPKCLSIARTDFKL